MWRNDFIGSNLLYRWANFMDRLVKKNPKNLWTRQLYWSHPWSKSMSLNFRSVLVRVNPFMDPCNTPLIMVQGHDGKISSLEAWLNSRCSWIIMSIGWSLVVGLTTPTGSTSMGARGAHGLGWAWVSDHIKACPDLRNTCPNLALTRHGP